MAEPECWTRLIHGRGPLEARDLASNSLYQTHRTTWLAVGRRAKAIRRLRLGDHFSILFENRMSAWLQIQEELRWIASPTPAHIDALLGRYNPLIAQKGELCASLFLDSADPEVLRRFTHDFNLSRLNLRLVMQGRLFSARPVASDDPVVDAVTYVRFVPVRRAHAEAEALYWCEPEFREHTLNDLPRRALTADLQGRAFDPRPRGGGTPRAALR